VIGESAIGATDQVPVEASFRYPQLVAHGQQHGLTSGIESESHAPHATVSTESQFLHVRVSGAFERVRSRSAKSGPEQFKQAGVGQ
jgi:hypothetical protein